MIMFFHVHASHAHDEDGNADDVERMRMRRGGKAEGGWECAEGDEEDNSHIGIPRAQSQQLVCIVIVPNANPCDFKHTQPAEAVLSSP